MENLDNSSKNNFREFNNWLLGIGNGCLDMMSKNNGDEINWITIPQNLLVQNFGDPVASIVNAIYTTLPYLRLIMKQLKTSTTLCYNLL